MGYKAGDSIKIIDMVNMEEYNGKTGKITYIDDIFQAFGTWGKYPIRLDMDKIKKIRDGGK